MLNRVKEADADRIEGCAARVLLLGLLCQALSPTQEHLYGNNSAAEAEQDAKDDYEPARIQPEKHGERLSVTKTFLTTLKIT